MSEREDRSAGTPLESGEESIDELGRNPTQQEIDEDDDAGDEPLDEPWVTRDGESS